MGFLLKIFLIGIAVYYILRSIGMVIARITGADQRQQHQDPRARHRREGDINIDHNPGRKGSRGSKGASEGDYIDYEEIK